MKEACKGFGFNGIGRNGPPDTLLQLWLHHI
jgi:hypothetical protein